MLDSTEAIVHALQSTQYFTTNLSAISTHLLSLGSSLQLYGIFTYHNLLSYRKGFAIKISTPLH